MLNAITTKMEIDVMQASELYEACQIASANAMASIVVHPQLTPEALMTRGRFRGKFKIITPVDWPKGDIFGMNKLRGLTINNLQSDGFEIMLTGGKKEAETRTEAKVITEFVRRHISPIAEIRFVLGAYMRPEEEIVRMCKVMKDVPTPTLLRTDHHLKAQAAKASPKAQQQLIEKIREVTQLPLKISGNIDSVRIMASCIEQKDQVGAARFAVSLQQTHTILNDLRQQPDLRKLIEVGI